MLGRASNVPRGRGRTTPSPKRDDGLQKCLALSGAGSWANVLGRGGHDYHRAAAVGALCAAGFFLRPTFAAFAAAPVFFWLQRGLRDRSYFQPFVVINFRATALLACFALTAGILVLTDSLYYGELTLRKLWDLEMDWSDWKVAPFHFVMYNTVQENLEQHGAHPKYLHAIVNVPLLFGPLGMKKNKLNLTII